MNTPIEITVEKIVSGGVGLGYHDRRPVFVPFTAPGDRISAVITADHRRYFKARCVALLEAGPDRIDPRCPVFTQCGGCQLRHLTPPAQLLAKQTMITDALQRIGRLFPAQGVNPVATVSESDGYRRRAGFKTRLVGDQIILGFFQAGSHRIVDLPGCPILLPSLQRLISPLRPLLASLSVRKWIPQVDAVAGRNGIGLVLHTLRKPTKGDLKQLATFARAWDVAQFWWQTRDKNAPRPVVKQTELEDHVAGFKLRFRPGDFLQTNDSGNRFLVDEVVKMAGEGNSVWDLFCGIGNFTLPLAAHFKNTHGVERFPPTLERARANGHLATIANINWHRADLLREDHTHLEGIEKADLILLDPPRDGAVTLIKQLATFRLPRILYVSCNPATFARDAAILGEGGFQLQQVNPMDMFPQTHHVELIAHFHPPPP